MTADARSRAGLVAFIAATLTAVGVLLFDLDLYLSGRVTVTEWATAEPIRAVAIVLATLVGPAGLAAHFWYYRKGM